MAQNGRSDEDARKLFIGGVPAHATKDDLQDYFGQFGEVQMATIKTDVYTGASRGFGFLIFSDLESVNKALSCPSPHEICGKRVEAKLATPQTNDGEVATKVFVGGLDKGATKESISAAFEGRGVVTDVFVPEDKDTKENKGFAFVTFQDAKSATDLCSEGKIYIGSKECDIKRAKNKGDSRGGGRGGFRGGRGFGGRGGGRGGYQSYGNYGEYDAGYQGGYGGYQNYGGQNYGGGYDQYGGGYDGSGYGGGYGGDQGSWGGGGGGYGGQDQYKMKGGRGGRGGYTPY